MKIIFMILMFFTSIISGDIFACNYQNSIEKDDYFIYQLVIDSLFSHKTILKENNSFNIEQINQFILCDSTFTIDSLLKYESILKENNSSSLQKDEQIILCDSTVNVCGDYIYTTEKEIDENIKFNLKRYSKKGANKKNDYVIDFLKKNKNKMKLNKEKFNYKIPINLISIQEFENKAIDTVYESSFPSREKFSKYYPNSPGFISVSQIGYNKKGNKAMLYIDRWCGGTCGEGNWIILEKRCNFWKIKQILWIWVS
jgi:hypothetical protein